MAPELLFTSPHRLYGSDGLSYAVQVYGQPRADGTWVGWLAFVATGSGRRLQTGRETTQPDRAALLYWATGLEPVYLEGAFGRAQPAAG